MNWLTSWIPSFFAPAAAWLFALLAPIIIFYFLKLRRNRVEISSLALWRQVINDQRVNAPFQKFKRNLLLLLQILLLTCVALAAMQPFWAGNAANLQYLPVLIDCSASMAAVGENGKTRLDAAKEDVEKIIDGLLPGQQLSLIAVGSTARRLTEFTDNQPTLRQALAEIQVQDVPSRIEDGLRLAQALSRTFAIERIRLYSDGNLPTRVDTSTGQQIAEVDVDLPFALDYFQIPAAGRNMGITALNARRSDLDRWDVFVRVDASKSQGNEGRLTLTAGGVELGAEDLILLAGESQRLVFAVPSDTALHLEARLESKVSDSLAADNVAWLDLPTGRPLLVYCPASLVTFRHALEGLKGVSLFPREGTDSPGRFDLVISDVADDMAKEAPVKLSIGIVPEELRQLVAIADAAGEIVDWNRAAPLLQHVQLGSVILSQSARKAEGAADADIEQLGFEIVAHGNQGPLIVRRRSGNDVRYAYLFHTDKSTLPYRVGFPVMISNLIRETMTQAALDDVNAVATGVLPALQLTPNGEYRVTGPSGMHDDRVADESGLLAGIPATQVGRYEVLSSGSRMDDIGVGLLSPQETSLLSVEKIRFNELTSQAQSDRLREDKPLWPYLAYLALFVLLFEWWYFQKRPAGVPE